MSPVKKNDAEQERLAVLEEIGIEEKALVYDEDGDKLLLSDDAAAIRDFYGRAFQEWSLGNVEGTAEEIFDAAATDSRAAQKRPLEPTKTVVGAFVQMATQTLPATAFKSPAIALSGVVDYEMYTKFRTQFDETSGACSIPTDTHWGKRKLKWDE
jgi:hypothetical protein